MSKLTNNLLERNLLFKRSADIMLLTIIGENFYST